MVQELTRTGTIVEKYGGKKSQLIQILLELQHQNGWLSEETLQWVSRTLDVPLAQIYHIVTFYKAFSLIPRGRHAVTVCLGTACQVRNAPRLLDKVVEAVKINPGETSKDMKFSLETVNCLGCCALGPVMVVDGKYYSRPSTQDIEKILAGCD